MKKNYKVLLMILIALMFLSACGGKEDTTTEVSNSDTSEVSKESDVNMDDVQEIEVIFSHNQPTASPEHAGAEKFKEVCEELSDGKVKVTIYPSGQMGSLREQVEGVQIGTINMSLQPSAVISPFVEDIKVCDLPYVWPKEREIIYEVLDNEMGRELLDRLESGGFHGLGYWFGGYKLLTTKGRAINNPTDMDGMKVRVMEAPILISQFKAWGANPVPVAYSELYNALQMGIVEGQENPLQTIVLNNFQEVQDNIIQSYHGVMMYVTVSNKAWWDGLSESTKSIIEKAEIAGKEESRKALKSTEDEYLKSLEATDGINLYELSSDQISEFKELSKTVYEEHYNTEWQKDYLQRLFKAIENAEQ